MYSHVDPVPPFRFLEAQLLSNQIAVTDSLTGFLSVSAISLLVVVRFGRSLRFYQIEFNKEAISNVFMAHYRVFRVMGEVDFK